MAGATIAAGQLLREWRQRRRFSQLELACEAGISARHLSFLETGRAAPSREMLLHLAKWLDVPIREQNLLLLAAGYAPIFRESSLAAPGLRAARQAIDLALERQKPWPAVAIDRHWHIVASNSALPEMYVGVRADLLSPPINALRLSLHPEGLAPRIVNLAEWRAHLLMRLRGQIERSADPILVELMRELADYPSPGDADETAAEHAIGVPLRIATPLGVLSFFSTTMVFGTPTDITLSELALEFFFPADTATVEAVEGAVRTSGE